MALTPLRWTLLAVGGALFVVTLLFRQHPERPAPDPREALAQRWRIAGAQLWRTADRLRATQIVDSVRPALARLPRTDTSRVMFDRAIDPRLTPHLGLMAGRGVMNRLAKPAMPVDVVFLYDTNTVVLGVPRGVGLQTRVEYLLPLSADDRCLVIARMRPIRPDYRFARRYAPRLLGPCAFYERFGMPGPAVNDWLMRGGWMFGRHASWIVPGTPWGGPAWAVTELGRWWSLRQWMTLKGFRCATGDAGLCAELLTTRMERLYRPEITITPPRTVSAASLSEWAGWRERSLGPMEARILGDMAADLGPGRFRRFWTSAQPVADAFRGAAGRDLGDWVTEWATSVYGEHGRGPAVPLSGFALALGLVAISAAGAGFAARRRQVN